MTEQTLDQAYQDLMNSIPPDTFVREANAKPSRVPTGTYKLTFTEKRLEVPEAFFPNGGANPNAGRLMVRTKATVERDGVKETVFPDLSPVERRNPSSNRLDSASQLWGHAIKTLGTQGQSHAETLSRLDMYPFKARVELTVKDPDGKFTNQKEGVTQDEYVDGLVKAGLDPEGYAFFNQVRSLSAWEG